MALIQVASGVPNPAYFASEPRASVGSTISGVLFAPGELALNLSHVPVFAFLAFVWVWSLQAWTSSLARAASWGTGLALSFAIVNELSQAAVPTRYASFTDALLNCVGIAIGLATILSVRSISAAA